MQQCTAGRTPATMRVPLSALATVAALLVLATPSLGHALPHPAPEPQQGEPDPNCPMQGLDCLFHDIYRASNSE